MTEAAATERSILKLKAPFAYGEEQISELAFRRGRLGDLKGVNIESVTVDGILTVAARLCGHPPALIEKLDEDDAGEVVAIVTGFLRRSLGTGTVR